MRDAWQPLGLVVRSLLERLEKRPEPKPRPSHGRKRRLGRPSRREEERREAWSAAKQAANSSDPPEAMTVEAVDPADKGHAALPAR